MIGIIIAMETEVSNILKERDFNILNLNGYNFYKSKDNDVVIVFSGIGKVNATIATIELIRNCNVKKIINIGSAGIYNNLNVLETSIVEKTKYGDVDVTAFGYEMGQVPKMLPEYETDKTMNEKIKKVLEENNIKVFNSYCYTTDSFINSNNINKYNITEKDTTIIEMECAAIAQTAFKRDISFSAIKIGIDKLWEPLNNEIQFNDNLKTIQKTIDEIIKIIIDKIK
ncbi:MAG: 5'-methylthioadenosine/S-adenosylhomocysteine nucleosidase [Mycoplasma sp.]